MSSRCWPGLRVAMRMRARVSGSTPGSAARTAQTRLLRRCAEAGARGREATTRADQPSAPGRGCPPHRDRPRRCRARCRRGPGRRPCSPARAHTCARRARPFDDAAGFLPHAPVGAVLHDVMRLAQAREVRERRRSALREGDGVVDIGSARRCGAPREAAGHVASDERATLRDRRTVVIHPLDRARVCAVEQPFPPGGATGELPRGARRDEGPVVDPCRAVVGIEDHARGNRDLHARPHVFQRLAAARRVKRVPGRLGGQQHIGHDVDAQLVERTAIGGRGDDLGRGVAARACCPLAFVVGIVAAFSAQLVAHRGAVGPHDARQLRGPVMDRMRLERRQVQHQPAHRLVEIGERDEAATPLAFVPLAQRQARDLRGALLHHPRELAGRARGGQLHRLRVDLRAQTRIQPSPRIGDDTRMARRHPAALQRRVHARQVVHEQLRVFETVLRLSGVGAGRRRDFGGHRPAGMLDAVGIRRTRAL